MTKAEQIQLQSGEQVTLMLADATVPADGPAGCIIVEHPNGVVDVTSFADVPSLDEAWINILSALWGTGRLPY